MENNTCVVYEPFIESNAILTLQLLRSADNDVRSTPIRVDFEDGRWLITTAERLAALFFYTREPIVPSDRRRLPVVVRSTPERGYVKLDEHVYVRFE